MRRIFLLLFFLLNTMFVYSEQGIITEKTVDIVLEEQKEVISETISETISSDIEKQNNEEKITEFDYTVIDEIELLRKDDIEKLEKRILVLKESYGITYKVLITKEAYDFDKISRKLRKTVVINLYKKDYYSLNVKIKFSDDINIVSYREEIDNLFDRLNVLVGNEYYRDLIFELAGNINVIISLIEREKVELVKEEFNRKIKMISLFSFLFFTTVSVVFIFIKKKVKESLRKCKRCGIEMDLCSSVLEGNKYVKTYQCKICGYIRKITSSRY